ncbi:MAG: hypothetical protein IJ632_05145 [Muribaculaceae bacterium]|nr:hypothetical protein [Muribaculaceae bacterium]
MKKYRFVILAFTSAFLALCSTTGAAAMQPDEEDYDESIRKPIRRLHPEREREKAIKKWEEEQARKAAAQQQGGVTTRSADPWGASDAAVPDGKETLYELLNKDYSLKQYVADGPKRLEWVDEPATGSMSGLLPHIDKNDGRYTPRGTSMKQSENAIYFYFVDNGPLRLRVQYFADDPLNFSEMVFTIDGFEYPYRPARTQRGRQGARFYWETSDEELGASDRDLVYALTHCHWARVKLLGANGIDHVKMFTTGQLEDFARLWQLYRLKGGTL